MGLKRECVIGSSQGREALKSAGIAAARVAVSRIRVRCKIAARARTLFVDGATNVNPDRSLERNAAPRMIAGAAHVGASREDCVIFRQCGRDPSPGFGVEFLT